MDSSSLVICEHCDAVYRRMPLRGRDAACCQRCGAELYRNPRYGLEAMLALTVTCLIAFIFAHAYPVITVELGSSSTAKTLWGTVLFCWGAGLEPVALLVLCTVFVFPLLEIALFLYVLAGLWMGRRPPYFGLAMRVLRPLQPWAMVEVFMLGVLVSIVKLVETMTVVPQIGLWGFATLTVLLTALWTFDLHEIWECAERIAKREAGNTHAG